MAHIDRALRSNIKLRHLQLLVALDEFRHLGRTAEFLSVSQPAISRTLTEVEKMLGMPLFARSSRGTEPTAQGAALVRFARSVLAQYDRTREEIAAVASGATARIRVGSMGAALPVLLADATERLKQRASRATVLIEEGDLTHLLPKLRLNELDLIVGRLEPAYAAPDLTTEPLYEDPMVAVVARGHRLLRKPSLQWRDLAAMPCVLPPPWASLRVKIEQAFFRHGLQPPDDVIESSSYLAISTFVRQRGAAAFLAGTVARELERQGHLRVLPLDVPLDLPPVGVIALRDGHAGPGTAQFLDCLREAALALAAAPSARGAARAMRTPQRRPGR